jgi:F-type H+-transporting ATPase subunit delta
MNDSKISVRYAKALFESAKEKDLLDEVSADMVEVQGIYMIPEFNDMLVNPVMKESQKYSVLDKVLGKKVQALTMSLLNLVFENGRELFIAAIARNYIDHYKKHKGIISATFTSDEYFC